MIPSIALAERFVERARASKRVLIGTHLNPDGDALGSALAISHFLDCEGIANEVLCNNPPPRNLAFLPGSERIRQQPLSEGFDFGIVVDLDSLERLGRCRHHFESLNDLALVDHHIPHEAAGTLRIVDVQAPATAVIIARILQAVGAPITSEIATCLICGIVTDTGSFRFRNTSPESLQITAMLIERGGDIVQVSEEVYQRRPMSAVLLLSATLANMKFSEDLRLGWSVLRSSDFEQAGALEENTEGLVNEILSIDTVEVATLIREPLDKKVRASLRSKGTIDVSEVARKFGGGGHRNAAGCTFDLPIEEAEKALVAALEQCLASS